MQTERRADLYNQLSDEERALIDNPNYTFASHYDELLPQLPYHPVRNLASIHWGQRKLLLMEVEFICEALRRGFAGNKVIYAGAADGLHINHLAKLFPGLTFECWDPAPFNIVLYNDPQPNVSLINIAFTIETARLYVDHNETKPAESSHLLFISDVRDPEHSDLDWQTDIVTELRPFASSLKFHLDKTRDPLLYFDGEIRFQPWVQEVSSETRLFVWDQTKARTWDMQVYERVLFHHNMIARNKHFPTMQVNPLINNSYDLAREIDIWTKYATLHHPGEFIINQADYIASASIALGRDFSERMYSAKTKVNVDLGM